MKKYLFVVCTSLMFIIACSDNSSELVSEKFTTEVRMFDNCTLELLEEDLVEDCKVFDDIYLDGTEIHIEFNQSEFTNIGECLGSTLIYDPNNTVSVKMQRCGVRDYHPLYCTTQGNAELVIDLGEIESAFSEFELCFVTECVELVGLLDDCFQDVGASSGGDHCFEVSITCQ